MVFGRRPWSLADARCLRDGDYDRWPKDSFRFRFPRALPEATVERGLRPRTEATRRTSAGRSDMTVCGRKSVVGVVITAGHSGFIV